MRVLGGFAQAVVGRLELLGGLGREQAASQEEARRSEDRQRTLDSLSAHIAIIDETGTIVAVNKAWRDFARANGVAAQNYAEGANYLRACDSAVGAYSEEAAPLAEGIRSVLSGEREKFELEYPCHSPSERRWYIGRVTHFAGGGPPRAVVAHENITERKLAEEGLHESERHFRALFENTLDAILIASDTGEYVAANEAACELFGVSLEELLGAKVEDFVRSGEVHQTRLAWQAFLEQGDQEGEFPLYRPDGEMRNLEFKAKAGFMPGRHLSILRDVTERKRAEEALRESEERYRKLFDSIDEGFGIIEMLYDGQGRAVDYRILETNPAFGRMTGFADAAGKTSLELNPDAEPYWFETLGRVVETGEDVRFESYAEALDQWFDVYASRVGGEGSRRLAIVFANITERKRAEEELRKSQEALRKSEEFHRFAVEAGRIGTWDLDLQTEECLISPKMAELMDFSSAQTAVPGAQWQESIVPEDRTLMSSALAASIASDAPFDLEFRIALKDGTQRWLYSRGAVSRDASGKAVRMYGASIDVTERKRAEEERDRLASIVESSDEAIISKTLDGIITSWNKGAERIYGYSADETVGQPISMLVPSERPDEIPSILESLRRGEKIDHFETVRVTKDGRRLDISLTVSPIRNSSGDIV